MKQPKTPSRWSIENWPLSGCISITGIITFAIALRYDISVQFLFATVLIWALAVLSYIDIKSHLLLDALTIPLLVAGLISSYLGLFADLQSSLIGGVVGYLIFVAADYAYQFVRGQRGLGRGDAKLLAALGTWFGWQSLSSIVLIASLAVIALAICNPAFRHRSIHIPFGPCLATGGVGWLFFTRTSQNSVISSLSHLFLI